MAAVQTTTTTVRAWDGKPITTDGAFADSKVPLAGFSIIEAADLDEVIRLVAGTPCARAKGAIEIRPIMAINDYELIGYRVPVEHPRRRTLRNMKSSSPESYLFRT
ncbi:MAG TPA: YciI family protein [Terracidiphilus sp.]|jgi:hypothetical protein|nr:YciI family protein [Terracidiphilus sp.]